MNQSALKEPVTGSEILLADDDDSIRTVIRQALIKRGYHVHQTDNGQQLVQWIAKGMGDLVITDVIMPGVSGIDALQAIRAKRPELPVIVISAHSTFTTTHAATTHGASEYFPKPFDLHQLMRAVETLLPAQPEETTQQPSVPEPATSFIGTSSAMQSVFRSVARMTQLDLTVLIEGESGTGKEVIARTLHSLSPRREKPFVALNMAAIPRELVESELFGHEKGAFTGASNKRRGKFSLAENGTLFLDEIGDMPLDAQAKLLRVLQEGEYTPVGGSAPEKAQARIICATHQNLAELCRAGRFREDLFFRLNVVPIRIPPLRERVEDIPELVHYFQAQAKERGIPEKHFSSEAIEGMRAYRWPGNVRELENFVYRISALNSEDTITGRMVEEMLSTGSPAADSDQPATQCLRERVEEWLREYYAHHRPSLPPSGIYDLVIRETEEPLIRTALEAYGGNQIKAAELLGINRNTLRKKIQELGIEIRRTVSRES